MLRSHRTRAFLYLPDSTAACAESWRRKSAVLTLALIDVERGPCCKLEVSDCCPAVRLKGAERRLSRERLKGVALSLAMLSAVGAAKPEPPAPKNQASAADTIILPLNEGTVEDGQRSPKMGRASVSVPSHLDHLALIAARVDQDGCMRAPLAPTEDERATAGLDALRATLVRAGVRVTLLPEMMVEKLDAAAQRRVRGIKGAFNLSYGQDPGRWFATRAELVACGPTDIDEDAHRRAPHAALAAMLAALHVDAVLAVDDVKADAMGPRWNVIKGALSSAGQDLDPAVSSASLSATLVLKDGSVPWSGDASAEGALRPVIAEAAQMKLKAFFNIQLGKTAAYRQAHPSADNSPPGLDGAVCNAIVGGDLQTAPTGSTLGPSKVATLQAAAERLVGQLRPWITRSPGPH